VLVAMMLVDQLPVLGVLLQGVQHSIDPLVPLPLLFGFFGCVISN